MTEALATNGAQPALAQAEAKLPVIQGAAAFELLQRAAKALSLSPLVPKEYQNSIPNCMIAIRIADRIGADPLMIMQNLDIVHGRPSWRAQFLIGTANSCGRFSAIRYEFFGDRNADAWGCRAWAIEKSTNEKLIGPDITIAIAKAEGWYNKNGSKWKTIPQLMLMYRAGAWWVRAYAPELSLGFHTSDEREDIIDITARTVESDDTLRKAAQQLGAPQPPVPVYDNGSGNGDVIDGEIEEAEEEEGILDRGCRLLSDCTTAEAVKDVAHTIAEELEGDDRGDQLETWEQYVQTRLRELKRK